MVARPLRVGAPGQLIPPAENVIRNARRAEEQGFAALWWPDHLMSFYPEALWSPDIVELARLQPSPHVYFDPIATMAAAAVSTTRIALGTAVTEPIRRHPALLAQSFLTLDHLSRGRVILGIGAGERENIEPYGMDHRRSASKLAEALAIIRLLWGSDEPVSFDGEFWRLRDAILALRPYGEDRCPPIWVAAHGPKTIEAAGRYGDGWLPTRMPPDEYGRKLAQVRAIASAHGRDGAAIAGGMWAYCVLADTHEDAHRMLEHPLIKSLGLVRSHEVFERHGAVHPLGARFSGMRDFVPTRYSRDECLAAVAGVPLGVMHDVVLHGTPDEVVAELETYAAQGLEHVILWNVTFLADLSQLRSSFAMVADVARRIHARATTTATQESY